MKVRRGRPPRLTLDAAEAGLLASLARQLSDLLDSGEPAAGADSNDPLADIVGPMDSGEPDDDPILRRLLPDAYRDDDQAAQEWRRLGRSDVRSAKRGAAARVLADLAEPGPASVPLDDERVPVWLGAITDMRLALGARLGITDDQWYDEALRLDEDDPRRAAYAVYDWLTTTQAVIIDAVD